MNIRNKGIFAALSSALFLGMTPIFGKLAIMMGVPPLAVVAIRTILAALILLVFIAIFKRQYLFIYPAGLLGCLLAGWINGLGSLFYYSALGRIGAGVGQLIFAQYPLFVALWLFLDKQPPSRLTLFRLGIAIVAVYLLTQTGQAEIDMIGVLMMLASAALYALHLPINQRVLYDMPAPTVTVYTLLAMSAVVVPAFFFSPIGSLPHEVGAWGPLMGLTLVTLLSRLTLFLGIKHIGGMQTAILGLSELLITMLMAQVWLGERFSVQQWIGAILLCLSIFLIGLEKTPPQKRGPGGWLSWLSHPTLPSDLPWQMHD
ncbi:MAG: DMT family transporter, partial [Chloroflexi bacterium]|nr:DMT family transporter [Chloroflexota bacterium]